MSDVKHVLHVDEIDTDCASSTTCIAESVMKLTIKELMHFQGIQLCQNCPV